MHETIHSYQRNYAQRQCDSNSFLPLCGLIYVAKTIPTTILSYRFAVQQLSSLNDKEKNKENFELILLLGTSLRVTVTSRLCAVNLIHLYTIFYQLVCNRQHSNISINNINHVLIDLLQNKNITKYNFCNLFIQFANIHIFMLHSDDIFMYFFTLKFLKNQHFGLTPEGM